MNNQEMDKLVDKLYHKFKGAPGVDQDLIRKCLGAVSNLNDPEIENKLLRLLSLIK